MKKKKQFDILILSIFASLGIITGIGAFVSGLFFVMSILFMEKQQTIYSLIVGSVCLVIYIFSAIQLTYLED